MNRTLQWILGVAAVLVIGAVLMMGGILIGQTLALRQASSICAYGYPFGPGMMGGYGMMNGTGMMGGYAPGALGTSEPLSLEEAETAVKDYLEALSNNDLTVHEIMIFDNHAYAEIVEQSTGIGAMEVLVDPVTLAVYPEHGPNMMWNLKYSPMSGFGGCGMMGMMRGFIPSTGAEISAEMPVTPAQAVETAQRYLDAYLPGAHASDEADPFYGYYTIHILRNGKVTGMLSVNGYSAQIFVHTWHGNFIEMSEE